MGHIYKYLGTKEQARQLWENREALDLYLNRLKELYDKEEPSEVEQPKENQAEIPPNLDGK